MQRVQVEASDVINASPEDVYAVISDYEVGHKAILPKPYFTSLTVQEGRQGAGTVVEIKMNVLGSKQTFRQVISEPEPGRKLVETDLGRDLETSFMVESHNGGEQSHVTILTTFAPKPGLAGIMEKVINPPVMRRIYAKELHQLDNYVSNRVKV